MSIQNKFKAGLEKISSKFGDGSPLKSVIKRGSQMNNDPYSDTQEATNLTEVSCVRTTTVLKDANGNPTGDSKTTLLIEGLADSVSDQDRVAVGVKLADVTHATNFQSIFSVETVSPGNEVLMQTVMLDD